MYNNNVSPSAVSQDTEGDTEWEGRRSKLSDQHKKLRWLGLGKKKITNSYFGLHEAPRKS